MIFRQSPQPFLRACQVSLAQIQPRQLVLIGRQRSALLEHAASLRSVFPPQVITGDKVAAAIGLANLPIDRPLVLSVRFLQ
jgi:hypothetical protein